MELEKHGFLLRECERYPDVTLGAAAHVITDLPSLALSGRSNAQLDAPSRGRSSR